MEFVASGQTIKTWSSTQHIIALSSAEVEFYALLKCACQTIGTMNLALDFGIKLQASVRTDASAALAITQRQGLGKPRHIDVPLLWIQERIKYGDIITNKIFGKENLADLQATHFSGDEINKHLALLDYKICEGKAEKLLTMNKVSRERTDYWSFDGQCVIRIYNEPRRNFCNPFELKEAPESSTPTSSRVTHGVFEEGTTFLRQDNWICKSAIDIDMGKAWTGRIVFIPKVNNVEIRSQMLVGRQQEVWRQCPLRGDYGPEIRAQVLTRNVEDLMKDCPRPSVGSLCSLTRLDSSDDNAKTQALTSLSAVPSGLHDALVGVRDGYLQLGASDNYPFLWPSRSFCACACAGTSFMAGRSPLPSVSKLLSSGSAQSPQFSFSGDLAHFESNTNSNMLKNRVGSPRHCSALVAISDEFSTDSADRRPLLTIEAVGSFIQVVRPHHNAVSDEFLDEIWDVGYPVGICNGSFNSEKCSVKSGKSKFQRLSEVSGVLDGCPIGTLEKTLR